MLRRNTTASVLSRPLNICIISQEFLPYTNWGGIAVYYSELSRALAKLGHRVVIVSRASPGAPGYYQEPNGVSVWRVGKSIRRRIFLGRTIDRILHARAVYRKILELDSAEPLDAIETAEIGLDGEALLQRPEFRKRMIIQCHGGNAFGQIPEGMNHYFHRMDFAWSLRRELRTLQLANSVVVQSEATKRALVKLGAQCKKVSLIYHGIDTTRFIPSERKPESRRLKVGFVGRLERLKGIDFLWKIVERIGPHAGIHFHLRGSIHPAWKNETVRFLRRFSSYVDYSPPGDHSEMPKFYRSLDVLLQPSRFENFGLAYVEAMASGLVLFAGKGGAGSEIVEDGANGFLVDPDGDPHDVVEKLGRVAADPHAFDFMRHRARADVVSRFSLNSCAQKKVALYMSVRGSCDAVPKMEEIRSGQGVTGCA